VRRFTLVEEDLTAFEGGSCPAERTGSLIKTSIVLLAVPFSAVGAIWLLYLGIAFEA
jgi:hypothetical protein